MDSRIAWYAGLEDVLLIPLLILSGVGLGVFLTMSTGDFKSSKTNEELFTRCLNGEAVILDNTSYVQCEVNHIIFDKQDRGL